MEAGNVGLPEPPRGAPERLFGQLQIPVAGGTDITFHEPLGVVGIIVPWNFPMRWRAGGWPPRSRPAAASCSSPRKPTPRHGAAGRSAREAGLPEHALTILPGRGLRRRALRHPPPGPQGLVHRLHPGREADHGRLRRAGEAGDPPAATARTSCSPMLTSRGRGQCAVRRLRQRRQARCAARGSWAEPALTRSSGRSRARRDRVAGADPGDEASEMGPADLRRAP